MGKVSFKKDIESQIAKVREHGYRETEKVPPGLKRSENRYFVKSFSGVLNVYKIIGPTGIVSDYFEIEKDAFKKMVKGLNKVTELYWELRESSEQEFKKYQGKTAGEEEVGKIFGFTKRNRKLIERAGKKHSAFLTKYSEFNKFCVRYTFAPEGTLLTWFVFGQTMTKGDCNLFFKFCSAVLDNHNVFVEIRGAPKGARLKYNPDVRDRAVKSYNKRKPDCRRVWNQLNICSSPHIKARELAGKFKIPLPLIENVIEGRTTTLTNFILAVVYHDVFGTTENQHLEYLRKVLRPKNPTRN